MPAFTNIDPGFVIVIVAALIFYLRLIILQRERVKRLAQTPPTTGKTKKGKVMPEQAPPRYSILSQNRRDWVIAGLGVLAILIGVLLNASILPFPGLQPYWWTPTAAGILAFGWAFKL